MKHQLDFEKPILELQRKLEELKRHPENNSMGIRFEEEAAMIEKKIEETKRQVFANLSAWDRIKIARHPKRPFSLDYVSTVFTDFAELHGDRLYADDQAMVGGFAKLGEHKVVVLGTQKGRDTKENIRRNFGSAHPEGYRKALRLMRLADKFGLPIVSLVDTAGAFPGVGSEERHIAESIAVNLREMMLFEPPIIAVVIGEGGSGGALGIAVADRVLILEHAYYSVIGPEGCAAILWKDRAAAPKAADALKITPKDLRELGFVDEVVPEPLGGAHNQLNEMAGTLKAALIRNLEELKKISTSDRLKARYQKYRACGHFMENKEKPAAWPRFPRRLATAPMEPRSTFEAASMLYPLTFQPIFKERIWGGRNLASLFAKPLPPGRRIGESWEICDRPDDESVIANGPLKGKTLRWLMREHPASLLGPRPQMPERFPLLIKIIDALETLSLQVHPPAAMAAQLGGEPKTEMWYVARCRSGGGVVCRIEKWCHPRGL